MHALVCALPLRLALPLQAATCALGASSLRTLACVIRSDRGLSEAAAAACLAAYRVKEAALLALGPLAASAAPVEAVCGRAAVELLALLYSAGPFFLAVSVKFTL